MSIYLYTSFIFYAQKFKKMTCTHRIKYGTMASPALAGGMDDGAATSSSPEIHLHC